MISESDLGPLKLPVAQLRKVKNLLHKYACAHPGEALAGPSASVAVAATSAAQSAAIAERIKMNSAASSSNGISGGSGLIKAILYNKSDQVDHLLQMGCDVNSRDEVVSTI